MTCRIFRGGVFTRRSEGRTYRRVRDPEIVDGVSRGEADIGFLGSDKFEEWQPDLAVDWLGEVPGCDLVLASRLGSIAAVEKGLQKAENISVITSYPRWVAKLAVENAWRLDIRQVSGSAEAYGDMADMIADLRVSGDTLRANRLCEFMVLARVQLGLVYQDEQAANNI